MSSISKNMCIDKLDNIVNKYINAYHRKVKLKPKSNVYIDFKVKNIEKILSLKSVIKW